MDKKILRNYFYNILYQVFMVITPLIMTPYTTRVLGGLALGTNDWTAGNVQWFVLFGILGVGIYGNKKIAEVRDNKEIMSRTFFEIFIMQFASMCISGLVYLLYLQTVQPSVYIYALYQGISLISVSLDITWFFYGVEDFKSASIRNMIVKTIGIILIFTYIKSPSDLGLFILINAISGVLGQGLMWIQLRQYIHFEKITIKGVLQHIRPNIMLFIPQIATSIYTILDVSMLGYIYENRAHVSYYQNAQRFIKMFLFFITSIGSVTLPRIANIHAGGEDSKEKIEQYLQTTLKMALYLAIPLMFGIVALVPSFIGWFMNEEYQIVSTLIMLATPSILFISLSNVYGTQYLLPTNMTKQYTTSVIVGALTNLVLNSLLMPLYGAYAAIINSVIAEFMVTFVQWLSIRKLINLSVSSKSVRKMVISSALMLICVRFVCSLLHPRFINNLLEISVGVIVYVVCLTVLKDEFHMEIIQKIVKLRKENG